MGGIAVSRPKKFTIAVNNVTLSGFMHSGHAYICYNNYIPLGLSFLRSGADWASNHFNKELKVMRCPDASFIAFVKVGDSYIPSKRESCATFESHNFSKQLKST